MKSKFYKLGELVEYKKGFAFKSSDYQNNGVRIIRVSDTTYNSIKEEGTIYISDEKADQYKEYELLENDLIISTVGSRPPLYDSMVGKVIKVPKAYEGSLLNQNAVRLRGKDNINQLYLYNQLKTRRYVYHIESSVRGNANQVSITLEDLFSFEIPLPLKEIQDKVALILSTWDKAIELKESLIEQKKEQKKGLMQKLLTGEVRLPGFDEEWKKVSFDDIFTKLIVKKHQIKSNEYLETGRYPVVDQGQKKVIAFSNNIEKVLNIPETGVIVFGDHTREIKFIDFDFIIGADGTQVLTTKNNNDVRYFYYQLLNQKIPNTGYNRHFKFLKEMIYNKPTLMEQNAISNILSTFDKELDLLEAELNNVKEQKKGLMQLLLTGKVQVEV